MDMSVFFIKNEVYQVCFSFSSTLFAFFLQYCIVFEQNKFANHVRYYYHRRWPDWVSLRA
jgi:hypothetical protein